MMRKLITNLILVGTFGFVLVGCGAKEEEVPNTEMKPLNNDTGVQKTNPEQGGGGAFADLSVDGK